MAVNSENSQCLLCWQQQSTKAAASGIIRRKQKALENLFSGGSITAKAWRFAACIACAAPLQNAQRNHQQQRQLNAHRENNRRARKRQRRNAVRCGARRRKKASARQARCAGRGGMKINISNQSVTKGENNENGGRHGGAAASWRRKQKQAMAKKKKKKKKKKTHHHTCTRNNARMRQKNGCRWGRWRNHLSGGEQQTTLKIGGVERVWQLARSWRMTDRYKAVAGISVGASSGCRGGCHVGQWTRLTRHLTSRALPHAFCTLFLAFCCSNNAHGGVWRRKWLEWWAW